MCSETAKLDRFWLESSAPIPWLGGAESNEGLEVFGRSEGVGTNCSMVKSSTHCGRPVGGADARIRRVAGFAASIGFAGHAGPTASIKLTIPPDPLRDIVALDGSMISRVECIE